MLMALSHTFVKQTLLELTSRHHNKLWGILFLQLAKTILNLSITGIPARDTWMLLSWVVWKQVNAIVGLKFNQSINFSSVYKVVFTAQSNSSINLNTVIKKYNYRYCTCMSDSLVRPTFIPTSALKIPATASTIRALVITVSKASLLVTSAACPMPSLKTYRKKCAGSHRFLWI